ncbi:uncharacterized protein LOC132727768 [Ruditapes philippinarum]|uniref:uncharacterized protein LOC132727768 n=1 Tax=Ruditapes philippinarum TaxID=129788 RepID=UPI00295A56EE|nr:uncharacterized protein LOC132727768 [Ruditapes philippinarum]
MILPFKTWIDEERKWKDCIKKKDVKAAREMLDDGNLPSQEVLQFAVNNFTSSNETREIVKDICQRIEIQLQEEHEEIEYIKGCYKHDDPYKNVVFVIKTSKPTTIRSHYRLYVVEQNNNETTKEMEGENCTGYPSEEMFQRACECLRMKSPHFMEAHSNLTRTSVRPVKLRKLQTPEKAVCIVFYVEAKGYIPIGENVLPEQIKYDDDKAFVTDVREGQCATAIAGPCDKHDDLKIGCKIVSNTDDAGTLGCFVNHPKDGLCAMSCAHVFLTVEAMKVVYKYEEKQNVESLGTIKCFQPGEPDLCGEVCDIRLFGNINNCGMDIAFFKVDEKRKPKTTAFPDVPAERISPLMSNGSELRYNPKSVMQNSKTMEMTLSTQFVKYGMKSNLTSGTYQCSGGSVRLKVSGRRQGIFRYVLVDQIEIRDKTGKFCQPGDSGAMVFVIDKNKDLMALGILTGRIERITYVTPIWNILKEIGMPLPYVLAEPI